MIALNEIIEDAPMETTEENIRTESLKKSKVVKRKLNEVEANELKELKRELFGKQDLFVSDVAEEVLDDDTDKAPVWKDDDDSHFLVPRRLKRDLLQESSDSYQNILQRKFHQTFGNPNWATKTYQRASDDEDDDFLTSCGNILKKESNTLAKGELQFKKVKDLNSETRMEGKYVNVVEFHPTSTVALVAGPTGIASIFQVDGVDNSKLITVKFKDFPISCAHFTTDGEQVIVGSRKSCSFNYYDMMEGKLGCAPVHRDIGLTNITNFELSPDGKFIVAQGRFGQMFVFCARTKEWIGQLKMNCSVINFCFSNDGAKLYSCGKSSEVYEWDMGSRRCVQRWVDDGCLSGTCIAASPNGQLLATGSSSGTVNIYQLPIVEPVPTPIKVVKNLVSSISYMKFNSTSEILAIASRYKKHAVKLVHIPSMTVFSNFPGFEASFNHAISMDFSPASGFFAIGNDMRAVQLFRLNAYKNY